MASGMPTLTHAMSQEHLLSIVGRQACASSERAELATRATLETLAERIAPAESHALGENLPANVARWAVTSSPADPFDLEEFVCRVADRESTDVETAEWHARAVFEAVALALGELEYERLEAQLSEDYGVLLQDVSAVVRSHSQLLPLPMRSARQ